MKAITFFVVVLLCSLSSCGQSPKKIKLMEEKAKTMTGLATATFGTGCFWCTEAVYQEMKGVESVVSGYSGGFIENPTYEQVCSKQTGHIECVEIKYDPKTVTYLELLEVFFRIHDPTSKDRQGNDIGPQYRSVIFYHDDQQKELAQKTIRELDASGAFGKPIVTEVRKAEKFYVAEDYHQNYFANNPSQGYCAFVVAPKVEKFRKVFKEKLKN
ncbi:MAG: peptide-methionine (S)-S-oxide reductase MsrA [Runella sp.]